MNQYLTILNSPIIHPRNTNRTVLLESASIYKTVTKLARNLNVAFEWQILLTLPVILTLLLYDAFYLTQLREKNLSEAYHILFEIFMGAVYLFTVVLASTMTVLETEKYAINLKKIDVTHVNDSVFEDMVLNVMVPFKNVIVVYSECLQVEALYMQVNYGKIRFSAVGVFAIDASLLTGVSENSI